MGAPSIPSTVRWVWSNCGEQTRRLGAAPARAVVACQFLPLPHPMTATRASPTGWLDGVCRKRHGAARMQARAARQLLEAAPERCEQFEHSRHSLGAGALRHLLVLASCV